MVAQPVGVAQRIPGPAGDRGQRQHRADGVARQVGVGLLAQRLQFHLVDAADAQRDQHQRGRQPLPRQAAVAARVAQVGADGDHHRQGADDHGRHRAAGALDGAGQAQVVQQVADGRQLERLDPVGAAELAQRLAVQPGERNGDQAERQVARHRLQGGGVFGQQQGADEYQPPHQSGRQGVRGSCPHSCVPIAKFNRWASLATAAAAGLVPDCCGAGAAVQARTCFW
ncbi:Uncharacterised protein [Achromobacter sp. 2789STDY5608621]|nr:Uncharacterised protein [Achromobacter sp. 2789STDY5608621]